MKIEKAYFTLAEIIARWNIPQADLVYLAETGAVRLSVRVFGLPLEIGDIEEVDDGQCARIPHDIRRFSGLLDIHADDAFRLFRDETVIATEFLLPGADYASLSGNHDGVPVRAADLLIRRQERDRFELATGFRINGTAERGPGLGATEDYREVRLGDLVFHLGPIQAEVVRALDAAQRSGEPWCNGKELLTAAGSKSLRMADVFKSKPNWRQLILSNRRGLYRLAATPQAE